MVRVASLTPYSEKCLVSELLNRTRMGRGVSSGGGQSSLGYLFGEAPKPIASAENAAPAQQCAPSPPIDKSKQNPADIHRNPANNYFRVDGQNSGNFITCRLHELANKRRISVTGASKMLANIGTMIAGWEDCTLTVECAYLLGH